MAKKQAPKKVEAPEVVEAEKVEVAEVEAEKVEVAEAPTKPVKANVSKDTYVMKVTHLAWGFQNKSHFYADKKPLINAEKMGSYANILKVWLANGWIEKGSYKK